MEAHFYFVIVVYVTLDIKPQSICLNVLSDHFFLAEDTEEPESELKKTIKTLKTPNAFALAHLIPKEGKQRRREPQRVEQLVLDGGGEDGGVLLVARLDGRGADVGVTGHRAVQGGLLLAVGGVGHGGGALTCVQWSL